MYFRNITQFIFVFQIKNDHKVCILHESDLQPKTCVLSVQSLTLSPDKRVKVKVWFNV